MATTNHYAYFTPKDSNATTEEADTEGRHSTIATLGRSQKTHLANTLNGDRSDRLGRSVKKNRGVAFINHSHGTKTKSEAYKKNHEIMVWPG